MSTNFSTGFDTPAVTIQAAVVVVLVVFVYVCIALISRYGLHRKCSHVMYTEGPHGAGPATTNMEGPFQHKKHASRRRPGSGRGNIGLAGGRIICCVM